MFAFQFTFIYITMFEPSLTESELCSFQITFMEHANDPSSHSDLSCGQWKTCNSYYSNTGPLRKRVSKRQMNVASAKRPHTSDDHLSRLERRALRGVVGTFVKEKHKWQ